MKMIAEIQVTTKKNETQATKWLVEKTVPSPNIIVKYDSSLMWEDDEAVCPYRQFAKANLGNKFRASLLRSDCDEATLDDSRCDFAGFDDNPGTITYRGKDLGEMQIELMFPQNPFQSSMEVRGFDQPTSSERKFIEDRIVPRIMDYIQDNHRQLYENAIAKLRNEMKKKISEIEKSLKDIRRQADHVIAALVTKLYQGK